MVAPRARCAGLLLRVFTLLALLTAAAAKDRGNPWKHKGARADDYNGKIPKELAANKAYFEERDAALRSRFEGGVSPLKFYDGITHLGIFGLPLEVRTHLAGETRIMTQANPVFMH